MANEEKYLYHICLYTGNGSQIQIVEVEADSIEGVDFSGIQGTTTLKLGGNEVGSFSSRKVVGWWKSKLSE